MLALLTLTDIENDNDQTRILEVICYQNLSVLCNNMGKHNEAINFCNKALKINPEAVKAFYQRFIANLKLKNFESATEDIKAAIRLNPNDQKLRNDFELLKKEKASQNLSQKNPMAYFFKHRIYNEKEEVKEVKTRKPWETTTVLQKLPAFNLENSQVFMDIEIAGEGDKESQKGRVVFELFSKTMPKTTENFRCLCTGEKGQDLFYKDNIFHKVNGLLACGGDITN